MDERETYEERRGGWRVLSSTATGLVGWSPEEKEEELLLLLTTNLEEAAVVP